MPKLKSLRHKHFQRAFHRQKPDNEQSNNFPPPVITMPPLMEFHKRAIHSASTIDNDTVLTDTHFDCTPPLRSLPRREAPILHSKMPNENLKRTVVRKPLNSIESAIQERSVRIIQDTQNRSVTVQRVHQSFQKQTYLPFDKK